MSDGGFVEQYQRVLDDQGKREGSQYVFYCPFDECIGHNKRKFYVSIQTGAWCCKRCQKVVPGKVYRESAREPNGGTWREFVAMVGDDPELWPQKALDRIPNQINPLPYWQVKHIWTNYLFWSALLPEHQAELSRRGLDYRRIGAGSATNDLFQAILRAYGTDKVVRSGLAYEKNGKVRPTRIAQEGRILIPYWDDEHVAYLVGYLPLPPRRADQTEEEYQYWKSQQVRYVGPSHYPTQFYGEIQKDAEYLILTEGPLKAEAAIEHGFPCLGLSGMGSHHREVAVACAKKRVKRVVILFDTEANPLSQDRVDRNACHLAGEFLKRKIPVFQARLPLDPAVDKGRKMDIDAFLLHHSDTEFAEVISQAVPFTP